MDFSFVVQALFTSPFYKQVTLKKSRRAMYLRKCHSDLFIEVTVSAQSPQRFEVMVIIYITTASDFFAEYPFCVLVDQNHK